MNHVSAAFFVFLFLGSKRAAAAKNAVEYGVDCSFPMHHKVLKCNDGDHRDLLGDKQAFYDDFMQGCRDFYGPKKGKTCDLVENERLDQNLLQPQSMVVRHSERSA